MRKRLAKEREQLEIAEKAVAIRQKTRELEWFEMESKVRSFVYQLIYKKEAPQTCSSDHICPPVSIYDKVQETSKSCETNKSECKEIRKEMSDFDLRSQIIYGLKPLINLMYFFGSNSTEIDVG